MPHVRIVNKIYFHKALFSLIIPLSSFCKIPLRDAVLLCVSSSSFRRWKSPNAVNRRTKRRYNIHLFFSSPFLHSYYPQPDIADRDIISRMYNLRLSENPVIQQCFSAAAQILKPHFSVAEHQSAMLSGNMNVRIHTDLIDMDIRIHLSSDHAPAFPVG